MSNTSDRSSPDEPRIGGFPESPEPQPAGRGRADGGTIAERVGRDPGNLGDEVADTGDLTHPTPEPGGPQI